MGTFVKTVLVALAVITLPWSEAHLECTRSDCYGSWRKPQNCREDNCKYVAEWCADGDEVAFTVKATTTGWVGIGFSQDQLMPNSDIVIAGVISDAKTFINDRWSITKSIPKVDSSQDIENTFVNHTDGVTSMYFTRKRNTGDNINDIELGCQYMLFAWGGKISFRRKTAVIRKHRFSEASEVEICICPLPTATTSAHTFISTPMLDPPAAFPSPSPTSVMTIQPECPPQCSLAIGNCQNNLVCMVLWQQYLMSCNGVIEWNGVGEAPLCSEECKEAAEQLKSDRLGILYTCCFCDSDGCRNGKNNFESLCKISSSKSSECITMESACSNTTKKTCQSCKFYQERCNKNPNCRDFLNQIRIKCRHLGDWDESINSTEPVCTGECRNLYMNLSKTHHSDWIMDHCCDNGKLADDSKLEDVREIIRQHRIRNNGYRFCSDNKTIPEMCEECKQEEVITPMGCLNAINLCLKDQTCKILMESMEKECENVHSWTKFSDKEPVCSEKCQKAVIDLSLNSIGSKWTDCDCHKSKPAASNSFTLLRDDDFEKKCTQSKYNHRTFCFHKVSCKGQQFDCEWLVNVCLNDRSCKQLHDDWENKCKSITEWTVDAGPPPVCTDECKQANEKFLKHKIWKKSMDCDCGKLNDNVSLQSVRRSEKCFRQRLSLAVFCGPKQLVRCPKDPCEPEMCSTAKDVCLKSVTCKTLYNDWERKCMNVWESSTDVCSDDCKNATYHLYQDQYGKSIKQCDCGIHVNGFFDVLLSAEELALTRQCFKRQYQMQSLCDEDENVNQCLKCKAEKVCQHACDKVMSYCTNSTECVMIWDNYRDKCKEVISWDGVSVMPICSNECKRWIDELDNNPFGKYLKCCKCNEQDENKRIECIKEREKMSIVCDIDYNSLRHCQQNEILCENHMDELFREHSAVPISFEKKNNTIRGYQTTQPTAVETIIMECRKDKCCRKVFHDSRYYCEEVMLWKNDTNTAPVCSEMCMNALNNLYADPLGKSIFCDGTCSKFSEINQNNLADLEATEWCNRITYNLENFCNASQNYECSHAGEPKDDICSVDNCYDALDKCQKNDSCKDLLNIIKDKCSDVLQSNSSTCSNDCKKAIYMIYQHPIGYKLKCCDCGMVSHQQNVTNIQCFTARSNVMNLCDINDDDCVDCKVKVCPQPCEKVIAQCMNDTKCTETRTNFITACKEVNLWDGNSTTMPTCTDECKKGVDELEKNAISNQIKCCECSNDVNVTEPLMCSIVKRNIEELCNLKLAVLEHCQLYKRACEHAKSTEVVTDSEDQCPPKICEDRCRGNQKCMKYYNDVQFYCRNVLEWKDDNNQPVCTVECQRAINRLSTVSRNTVGFDILCCTCGNYSDLKHNNLESIRSWERCRRENSNIAQFCDHNCTDCSEMKSLDKPQRHSCKVAGKICDEIDNCKAMRRRFHSNCANVLKWERGSGIQPQCSNECKQAIVTWTNSDYRNMLCCDCLHDEMTAKEKHRCVQVHRNIDQICNFRITSTCETCRNNRNNSDVRDDCFYQLGECNEDMQCREFFFHYTDKCLMAISGEFVTPDQVTKCKEAASKVTGYKDFGDKFMKCDCVTYPELCSELFKNRFLFDELCDNAERKCKSDRACLMLWNSYNSCTMTDNICSLSCQAKAVLLYRHRFGKAWWNQCRPHYFEQMCFALN